MKKRLEGQVVTREKIDSAREAPEGALRRRPLQPGRLGAHPERARRTPPGQDPRGPGGHVRARKERPTDRREHRPEMRLGGPPPGDPAGRALVHLHRGQRLGNDEEDPGGGAGEVRGHQGQTPVHAPRLRVPGLHLRRVSGDRRRSPPDQLPGHRHHRRHGDAPDVLRRRGGRGPHRAVHPGRGALDHHGLGQRPGGGDQRLPAHPPAVPRGTRIRGQRHLGRVQRLREHLGRQPLQPRLERTQHRTDPGGPPR